MTLLTLASPGSPVRDAANALSHHHAFPCALDPEVCDAGIEALNQLLADIIALCDMYRKHRWQMSGPAYYPLHLLFDRHYEGQIELVAGLVERVKDLGGVAIGMAREVAAATHIPACSRVREDSTIEIARLLDAHEIVLEESRIMARDASDRGDRDTGRLIHSDVVGTHEMQVMFLHVYLAQDAL